VGAEKLSGWAKEFGLGEVTGIDLPGEVAGLVPTPEWKKAVKGERWFLGNTYHMAIGQGDLAVTPIANHRLAMFVANGGELCDLAFSRSPECRSLKVSPEALELLKEGMKGACDSGGTGVPFFDFEPEVGCKTGTAETAVEDETHAWFTAFAPYDNPEYVITVLVEKGGEGSAVAAPIARSIMDYIFHP
jgi:penicillin-binding protein 2